VTGFEWAENNLDVRDPHELQGKGVNVFFAPNIERGCRLVNLATGRVKRLQPEEEPPQTGYFADLEGLRRYLAKQGIELEEIDGQISLRR